MTRCGRFGSYIRTARSHNVFNTDPYKHYQLQLMFSLTPFLNLTLRTDMADPSQFRFLNLPLELRCMIYESCTDRPFDNNQKIFEICFYRGLLFYPFSVAKLGHMNQQIRFETLQHYLSTKRVIIGASLIDKFGELIDRAGDGLWCSLVNVQIVGLPLDLRFPGLHSCFAPSFDRLTDRICRGGNGKLRHLRILAPISCYPAQTFKNLHLLPKLESFELIASTPFESREIEPMPLMKRLKDHEERLRKTLLCDEAREKLGLQRS